MAQLSTEQLLLKAKSLAGKGDVNAAAQMYRSVLQRFPKNKRAIHGLKSLERHQPRMTPSGQPSQNQINALISLLQQGHLDKVVEHATPLARKFPNAVAFLDFLGIAHMGLQNYDQCIASYQKALNLKPDFVEAHNNLGAAFKAKGQLDDAITSYQKALKIKPDYAEAHNNLGIAQQEKYDLDDAITSFEAALQIAPNYADAYFNLGSALKEKGLLAKAILSFEKGLQFKPNHAEAHNHLGNTLQLSSRLEDACVSYKKALHFQPSLTETYLNLGNVFIALGNVEDAIANYKSALKLKPDYAEAYRGYTSAVTFKAEDEYTARIPELLNSKTLSENDQMHLSFAQSKVKLDLGQDSEGIKFLQKGNALRKKELNYDISIDECHFDDIRQVFSKEDSTEPNMPPGGIPNNTPVFILGMPRSGTTLIERIIASHSDVYGADELTFMDNIMHDIDWEQDPLHPDTLQRIRTEYYDNISTLKTNRRFVTDKTPANFRWIGFIAHAFPEAKIIHIDRNPAAVCWSNYKLYFPANGMRYSFDMEDVAKYYGLYQNLMTFWQDQFPNRIYDINYEQLTENQLEETEKLLAHIGLDWQDTVMDFHKNTTSVRTASNQQVRTKMYQGSSQEWERYKEHLNPMLNILKALPR